MNTRAECGIGHLSSLCFDLCYIVSFSYLRREALESEGGSESGPDAGEVRP